MKSLPILALLLAVVPIFAQPTEPKTFTLPNGLRVLLFENHERPFVRAEMRVTWRAGSEPKSKAGLTQLTVRVLAAGSVGARSREAFNRAVEERGLRLDLKPTPDGLAWTLLTQSADLEPAFELLGDMVFRALPDGANLEDQRVRFFHQIQGGNAVEIEEASFHRALLYPDQTPEPVTEVSLSQIYFEDLQQLLASTVQPQRAVLGIYGDLDLNQARQLAQDHFAIWSATPPMLPALVRPLAPSKPAASSIVTPAVATIAMEPSQAQLALLARSFRPTNLTQSAALELLCLWLPRRLGVERAEIVQGADGWRSLVLKNGSGEVLKSEIQNLRDRGFSLSELTQAKALWGFETMARNQHPEVQLSTAVAAGLPGAQKLFSDTEIQAVDLSHFNETLRAWMDSEPRMMVLGATPSVIPNQTSIPKRDAKSK